MESSNSGLTRNETDTHIEVNYASRYALFDEKEQCSKPVVINKKLRTEKKVPQLGVMLVGLGGNNGSTFVAGMLANKGNMSWLTKNGEQKANFFGSFTQSATTHVGFKHDEKTGDLQDVFKPVKSILPMVDPINFDICGWDISAQNLYEAANRAHVLEPSLIAQLKPDLEAITPMKAVLNPDFIASNQADRADNVRLGTNQELIDLLRVDIQACKARNDKVIVLWTANTEMFLLPEINTIDDLENRIKTNQALPASVLYCVATILEGVTYLNGSPQNTFHPAIVEYAAKHGALLAGSDFKSGQTRFKTVMSDFLIGSGIRISSVVSYNHLGNNDGKNLSEDKTFRSKQISKAGVLDDAIKSNSTLYPEDNNKIDHEVVIKYVPFVGDSKRALDEYSSSIFLNGINTISSYNICEDSLLAVPLMFDMIILAELFSRMEIDGEKMGPILSYLSFFFKAPITNHNEYVINSFGRQRETLCNLLKACSGILPDDTTLLNFKF